MCLVFIVCVLLPLVSSECLLQWILLLLGGFPCLSPALPLPGVCSCCARGLGCLPGNGPCREELERSWHFPAAVDLCLEALCKCQGKLCFVLANSSHSLGCCGVCTAQGCAWALPGGSGGNISGPPISSHCGILLESDLSLV